MLAAGGRMRGALKVVIYGPEGIGKSTLASKFPDPVFIDTEGSTRHMDVMRTPAPKSYSEILRQIDYYIAHTDELQTLVIDTADWAEDLCAHDLCASRSVKGIEDFGYGKGYTYLAEDMGKMLNRLTELTERGVHTVLTAHAMMRKFEQPDEMGSYDRWEMKLEKKVAAPVKEWADLLLFCSYKTLVISTGEGLNKKNKAQGGKRIMYTSHHPCWDAKNRFGLPDEIPIDFASIAHLFGDAAPAKAPESAIKSPESVIEQPESVTKPPESVTKQPENVPAATPPEPATPPESAKQLPAALTQLMAADGVTEKEIMYVVGARGYFPGDMPVADYDPAFIRGVLIAAWPQILNAVKIMREDAPF